MTAEVLSTGVLDKLPMFAEMSVAERQELLEIAQTVEFAPGDVLMHQGQSSQMLCVVLEGNCRVVKQGERGDLPGIVLAELNPNDHFGEISFFHSAPHSASVEAITAVRLLRINRSDYDHLIEEGSLAAYKLASNILYEFSGRLRRMGQWVSELMSSDPVEAPVSEWSHFRDKLFDSWNV